MSTSPSYQSLVLPLDGGHRQLVRSALATNTYHGRNWSSLVWIGFQDVPSLSLIGLPSSYVAAPIWDGPRWLERAGYRQAKDSWRTLSSTGSSSASLNLKHEKVWKLIRVQAIGLVECGSPFLLPGMRYWFRWTWGARRANPWGASRILWQNVHALEEGAFGNEVRSLWAGGWWWTSVSLGERGNVVTASACRWWFCDIRCHTVHVFALVWSGVTLTQNIAEKLQQSPVIE